jgi:hypothetical protein
MKTQIIFLAALLALNLNAQDQKNTSAKKTSATVLNVDSKGISYDEKQMGNLLRIELEKLDTFQVMDRYDVSYVVEKNKLKIENCYGKICLTEIGKIISSDKMLTGTIEQFGEIYVLTLRLIDVKAETIEKIQVNEYLKLPDELQLMVRLSLLQLFDKPVDKELLKTISKKNNYENSLNNHNKVHVNLNGPRSGFAVFTGKTADILRAKREDGGFDADPVMFQFGYQFEKQYLNEGNCQALFEFLPTITGFNQNIFIPSLTIMNGFRENKYGWEIGFGPSFSLISKADVYKDSTGHWALAREWNGNDFGPNPNKVINRVDSRGNLELSSFFIVAIGKTFRSGRLNIPLNAYVIPSRDGWRFGMSVGFNAKKTK